MLSPPKIVAPITACADRVRLQGQKTGSTVRIWAGPINFYDKLFEGTASAPDEIFVLSRRLASGEFVFAEQDDPTGSSSSGSESRGETVEPEPAASEIGPIVADSHLHVCARCAAFGNAFPGAEIVISSDKRGEMGRGAVDPESGVARVNFKFGLRIDEVLSGRQTICGMDGPLINFPTPDWPGTTRLLPAPSINEPIYECDRSIEIEGIAEGATVRLFRRSPGREYASFCVDANPTNIIFPDPLSTDESGAVWIDQSFPACEIHGAQSNAPEVRPVETLKPFILGTPCNGMLSIGVGQLRFGASVSLVQIHSPSDGQERGTSIGEIEAWATVCDIPLTHRLNARRGNYVRAIQSFCGQTKVSNAEKIRLPDVAKPRIESPLYECACIIRVRDITPGAKVELYTSCEKSPGWRRIFAGYVLKESADLPVSPKLIKGTQVFARQIACGTPVEGDRVSVGNHPDLLDPIVEDCGDHLCISGVVPGARVEIYVNGEFFKRGRTGGDTLFIDLSGPFPTGTKIQALQFMCQNSAQQLGPGLQIRNDVLKNTLEVVGTTIRICQLTGESDPEGKVHLNNSLSSANIIGTDLGIVVDHDTGDGKLYLFFGDTNIPEEVKIGGFTDTIAWTEGRAAGPNGPLLEFLHRTTDNGTLQPVEFGIHNVSQLAFEVPTGGFSHAGKLYVFASTDQYDAVPITPGTLHGPQFMGRSVLASAGRADEMFQVVPGHGYISHHDWECFGRFKFINIAAQKIKNDDWPYLPENAQPGGEGLILIGSGRYRESQPCLAYVPLPPDQDPVFSEWRYLSGFSQSTKEGDLCGVPAWSDQQEAAVFLFEDSGANPWGYRAVVGELSIAFLPQVKRWVLLYGGVLMRWADCPWGPWSKPILVFDFSRDHADYHRPKDLDLRPRFIDEGSGPYGPYIIPRFTEFDELTRELTIFFVMSTWSPYQVMLMRTVLREDCGYVYSWQCPTGTINTEICTEEPLAPGSP